MSKQVKNSVQQSVIHVKVTWTEIVQTSRTPANTFHCLSSGVNLSCLPSGSQFRPLALMKHSFPLRILQVFLLAGRLGQVNGSNLIAGKGF